MDISHVSDPKSVIQMTRQICASESLDAQIERCIRFQKGRYAILEGNFCGVPAIFRVALSDRTQLELQKTWNEVERIGAHMADGSLRVAQGLKYSAKSGLLISERANGDPYLTILKQQPETVHAERIANWLAQYNAPTFEWRKAGPSHWIKQAQKSSARQPHDFLRSKEIQILDQMAVLATQFDPQNWRVAISHGDYHPNNLLWDGNVLTGIDIGGSAYLPIYKDIARSLVHLARRDIKLGAASKLGTDKTLIDAFTDAFKLNETEIQSYLPFFIGFECLIKVETLDAPVWRQKAAERMYDGFLAEFS